MIRLEEILDKVEKQHPGDNLDLIRRAYIFSAKEHKGHLFSGHWADRPKPVKVK